MPTISAQKLKTPLSIVTALSAPSSKTPMPAFQSTAIQSYGSKMRLRCDGQYGMSYVDIPCEGEEFGSVFVNTQNLRSAISATGDEISISRTKNGILLSGARSDIELRQVDCDREFTNPWDECQWHQVDGKKISKAIRRTTGLFDAAAAVTLGKEGAVFCTANRSRFVWTIGIEIPFTCAIPSESVKIFANSIDFDSVSIGDTNGLCLAKFSTEDFSGVMAVRKMEYGNLAPYDFRITQSPIKKIASVLKSDIVNVLLACSVVETKDNAEVFVKIADGIISFKKRATDHGVSQSSASLQNFDGTEIQQSHDSGRLLRVIQTGFADELSVDVCVISTSVGDSICFCSGNTVGISAPLVDDE